ncbi:MAG: hypothetical protein QOK10_3437 [Pseudonocardiales bacterium]|jgi:hypothetical protein|nr:hypothetical protein [Pseudonocardiales bacterium]
MVILFTDGLACSAMDGGFDCVSGQDTALSICTGMECRWWVGSAPQPTARLMRECGRCVARRYLPVYQSVKRNALLYKDFLILK